MALKKLFANRSSIQNSNKTVTSAAALTLRQSLWPLTIVTILFFLWGFAYGLLDTLNKHFQVTLGITRARSSGLQAAYFGAYPLASLGYANWILRHAGYKAVFIFGLSLYGIGALMMWPAGVYQSFGGFCGATFIIGSGLGSLETAANPFIVACGPPRYAEIRINVSQTLNAVGTIVGPLLGSYVFFTGTQDTVSALKSVQWVYLGIACFVFLLAGVFFFSSIPEISDADMEAQVQEAQVEGREASFWKQYRLFHAAFAQFCYVGAQVAVAGYFINYAVETRPGTSTATGSKLLSGAQGAFAVGRVLGTILMKFVRPRYVLLAFMCGAAIFIAPATKERGNTGISFMFLVLFFESICFPTIVALGTRGLGRHYKRGSGWIIGGVLGGAAVPPLLGVVADMHNNTGIAMVVPLSFFVAAVSYPIALNFVASYRIPADASTDSTVGLIEPNSGEKYMQGSDLEQIEVAASKV
ncbi:l-fucose permease [Boeremia exigua]|uniref:l-fucose permease n=1 Tax=Boeremia exigua TaxID=749465 RepID=UPI001E8D8859|nr:l-fucose permease [Boeremia exigua]KAH6613857.1 l-fucose permease [Boeremia exigua]